MIRKYIVWLIRPFPGIGWGTEIDVFSAGCVMYELHTGRPLLPATSDIFFLFAMMEGTIGNFEKVFADRYNRNNPTLFHEKLPRTVNFPHEADTINPESIGAVKKARLFAVINPSTHVA